ncbi:hypothetical protein MAM1_0031d02401 [Mucor ambiguus]|uniref:Uncharacterized protein n=1 Tax=Mucor ambiguus TaxID=91626 RepID=A0A0C9M2H5_9FUNG|nr:hypothetical protein MAM1_0031d02401 [Mucor ambiguus]
MTFQGSTFDQPMLGEPSTAGTEQIANAPTSSAVVRTTHIQHNPKDANGTDVQCRFSKEIVQYIESKGLTEFKPRYEEFEPLTKEVISSQIWLNFMNSHIRRNIYTTISMCWSFWIYCNTLYDILSVKNYSSQSAPFTLAPFSSVCYIDK